MILPSDLRGDKLLGQVVSELSLLVDLQAETEDGVALAAKAEA
jgi:hypothetical protein